MSEQLRVLAETEAGDLGRRANQLLLRALVSTVLFRGTEKARITTLQLSILKKVLAKTDGRDKLVKVVQYSGKLLLWLVLTKERAVANPNLYADLRLKVSNLASSFSTFRKIVRLLHAVEPISDYMELAEDDAKRKGSFLSELSFREALDRLLAYANALIGVANDIVDDVICLSKIGVLDKTLAKRYEYTSSVLWYSSILIDLYDNLSGHYNLYSKHLQAIDGPGKDEALAATILEKRRMSAVNTLKLLADFVFCTVDILEPKEVSDGYQILAGLLSGGIGLYKHWLKAL